MTRLKYQDYVINASSRQLSETGRWSLNISIEHHYGAGVEMKPYSAANTFENEADAVQQCFLFGRQIIDGNVAGCTAP